MTMTVHSIGTTEQEIAEIATMMPWMRHVVLERIHADVEFGDYEYLAAMEYAAKVAMRETVRLELANSDCPTCREFAPYAMHPSHDAPLGGHPNHCTCNGCW